ncbi:MAG TPA: T9SS type A sorting domain-containing protein, partial [Bacteroidetes bacterium]|nr:T9SS type A sorting domain-containing protein [Bacteroidota bacterium]
GEYFVATGIDPDREENRVYCFRNADPDPVWTFEVPADEAFGWYGVNIAHDGSVVVVNGKYRLYVINLEDGELIWEALTYNTESFIPISADASVLVVGSLTGVLLVYIWSEDDQAYRELWRYRFRSELASWVSACQVSLDGSIIAAGTLDFFEDHYGGRLALFETGRGSPLWVSDPLGDEISEVALNSDAGIVAATSWGDLQHQTPDLVIHERHSPEPFYSLSTPGSMTGLAMSDDGGHVVVGGKGVHSRQFGRGGRVSMVSVEIPGGRVAGVINDEGDEAVSGAVVSAAGNPYTAVSDQDGQYLLMVEVEGNRGLDLTVRKPGFMDGFRADVRVVEGEVTDDVDFTIDAADHAPEGLRASEGRRNRIILNWDAYNNRGLTVSDAPYRLAQTALGDRAVFTGATPWMQPQPPRRDGSDEAEAVNIYRSYLPGGPYRLIAAVDGDETTYYDDSDVFPNHRYYYVITADFGDGESDYSGEAVGWLDDDFLQWDVDLAPMADLPRIDGTIDEGEWEGAVLRDISDVFGYDDPDSAGSVEVRIGLDGEGNRLLFGFSCFTMEELQEKMGVGIYVDDDGNGEWTVERAGTEGNYWAYWIEGEPSLRYRSLYSPPYNADPYYIFENPELAFSDRHGYVEIELALPLGFHEVQEIGLYHPDYTIGLGLFAMQRDEEDNAIFNGWWPQNMFSIVSFPEQFARVHVPLELTVPPVAPEEVTLNRDGEDLELTWTDPTLGIDGGELRSLAGVRVYRNGELTGIVDAGTEQFIDDDVVHNGWYEYSLVGYVLDGEEVFEGAASRPVGTYAGEDPDLVEIGYDDGTAEGRFVVAFDGGDNRFAVCFDLSECDDTVAVYQVEFFAGDAAPIDVYIAENHQGIPGEIIGEAVTADPYEANAFHRLHFPGVDQPVVVSDPDWFHECWVVLDYLPDSPGSPSIGVDTGNADAVRNLYYRQDSGWQAFGRGQLMVRILVGAPIVAGPVDDDEDLPLTFRVGQNYPNPFNGSCLIPFDLVHQSAVSLELFGIDGRFVRSLDLGMLEPGYNSVLLNAATLSAGVYFVRLISDTDQGMIRILLVK